jgi:hypothetical protein
MEAQEVYFKLPSTQAAALRRLAAQRDVTVGQIIREAIANEIRRETRDGRGPNRADETLLAPLRALLAAEFAEALGWADLQQKLEIKGYRLREAGGGLALHTHPSGERVCKASELGYAYSKLMRRFGAPFPGHAHGHLVKRVLPFDPDEDQIDLIEPF